MPWVERKVIVTAHFQFIGHSLEGNYNPRFEWVSDTAQKKVIILQIYSNFVSKECLLTAKFYSNY